MKITRSEAITMAVRRRIRACGYAPTQMDTLDDHYAASVRKHFSRVCGQYEVADDPNPVMWKGLRIRTLDHEPIVDRYDGYGLK